MHGQPKFAHTKSAALVNAASVLIVRARDLQTGAKKRPRQKVCVCVCARAHNMKSGIGLLAIAKPHAFANVFCPCVLL